MTPELANLIKALQQLAELPPIERARRCPALIDEAKTALAHERGAAIDEAVASGDWTQAAIGRELGTSRQKIHDLLTSYREQGGKATPPEV